MARVEEIIKELIAELVIVLGFWGKKYCDIDLKKG